jgi:hypothetical protein
VDLAIKMTADASDAADAFDQVGSSASAMADDVAAAAGQADTASRDLAGGVDALGSSSAQAAGGLGDLGGALSLMPGPLGAVGGGMESLAPLIMGATGAADLMSLAMEKTGLATAKAKAQAAAHAVATKAQAAATKTAAAVQWLFNAAMSANPLGLLLVGLAAAIGLFVLLYKRSDTFRALVQKVGDLGQKAIGFIVDKAKTLGEKLDDLLEPVGGLSGAVEAIGDVGKKAFELWLTPLRTVIDLVKNLIDWISKIDIPDLSSLPGLRVAAGFPGLESSTGGIVRHTPAGWTQVNVTINGAVDKLGTARELDKLLTGYGLVQGRIAGP